MRINLGVLRHQLTKSDILKTIQYVNAIRITLIHLRSLIKDRGNNTTPRISIPIL